MYACIPAPTVLSTGAHYVGTLHMMLEEDKIEHLERQLNVLRKKQIFNRVEIPYSKFTKPKQSVIPRESEVAKDKPAITEVPKKKPKGPITRAFPKPTTEAEAFQENQDKGKSPEKSKWIAWVHQCIPMKISQKCIMHHQ